MTRHNAASGQTIIMLLIFMMLAITLALSATAVVIINTRGDTAAEAGELARQYAEGGIENAILRLERDASYPGETMTLAKGTATITISGTSTKTIVSVGNSDNAMRTVTATATITSGVYTVSSWSETP